MTQRIKPDPDVVCPNLAIKNLVHFHKIYTGLQAGKTQAMMAVELGVSLATVNRVISSVEESLAIPGADPGFIVKSARRKDEHHPAARFHNAIGIMLKELTLLVEDCRKAPQQERVIIEGTEFGILWVLPHVLSKSNYLESNPSVILEIRRTIYAPDLMTNMEKGQSDLAIGLIVHKPATIRVTPLLTASRTIIYRQGIKFKCGKDADQIGLSDLSRETVFVIPGDPSKGLGVERHLPEPEMGGRRVYLDSTSHMYQYVRQGLGVAIGYDEKFIPVHMRSQIMTKPLPAKHMPSAQFCLYFPTDRLLSPVANALKEAIEREAPTLGV